MLLFLSVTGITLSIILLYFNGRNFKSAIYLGGFFFMISYYSFIQYVLIYSESVRLVSVFYLNFTFLGYLIGPMLYWYIRSVLIDNSRLRMKDLWHLLPALLIIIISLPYIFSRYSLKVEIAGKLVKDISNLNMISISSLYDFIPGVLIYMSRPLLVLLYACWSGRMLFCYVRKQKSSAVLSSQLYMIKWLFVLLGFLIILVVSHLILMAEVYMFKEFKIFSALNMLTVISGIGLIGLLISPFFFPGILYGLPRISDPGSDQAARHDPGKEYSPEELRMKNLRFESDYIHLMQQKVIYCMEQYQPYLQVDCNLASLSKLVELPVHHLAYYFREERKQSFNDFRNEYRVKHAKNLIQQGKAKEMTLEAIGLLSGFSTRKTFIASFKKVEGVLPGVFLARSVN